MYENPRYRHRRHSRRHHRFHNPAGDPNTDRTERIKRVMMASLVIGSVALGTAVLTDKLIGLLPASVSGSATISGILQIALGIGGALAIGAFANVPSLAAGVGVGGVANGIATLWDSFIGASNPSLAINIPYTTPVLVPVVAPVAPATTMTATTPAGRAGQVFFPGLPPSYVPLSQQGCAVPLVAARAA